MMGGGSAAKSSRTSKREELNFVISGPKSVVKDVSVTFNKDKNKYEGLPTVWRELMDMEPQDKEMGNVN
jgi:hypothetical protein